MSQEKIKSELDKLTPSQRASLRKKFAYRNPIKRISYNTKIDHLQVAFEGERVCHDLFVTRRGRIIDYKVIAGEEA